MTMAGTRVHAFADDALAADDAVGLVARMRAGEVSAAEIVEAAVARAERVQPALNGLCVPGVRPRPGRGPRPRGPASSPASPPSSRTTSTSPGCRPSRARDACVPRPAKPTATSRGCTSATGLVPLGQDPALGVRLQRQRRVPRRSVRSATRGTPTTPSGASSAGSAAFVAAGRRPDRARQRRRRLDPDPRRRQRPGRAQAHPRPAAQDKMMREMPVRIVARRRGHPVRARHGGVLPRGRAGLPQPASCRRSATSPGPVRGRLRDRAGHRAASAAAPTPEVTELTLEGPRRCSRSSGHHVEHVDAPVPDVLRRRLPPLLVDARLVHRPRTGRRHARPLLGPRQARQPHPRPRPARPRATCTGCPVAIRAAARAAAGRRAELLRATYDVVLTPTLAHPTPRARLARPDPGLRAR